MRKLAILTLVLSLLLVSLPTAGAAPPSQAGSAPAILSFSTPLTSVDRNALAQRTARVPVSWDTANRPFIANLVFDQVLPDGSAINVELPRPLPWVASTGQGMAAPILPDGQATNIVLRMRMINMLTREVYAEKTITLPIGTGSGIAPDIGDRATITSFATTANAVPRAQLQAQTARVPVSWSVANRPPTSNLYFEQVMPDGSAINVELPRENPWVNSSGVGVAAPRLPGGSATSVLLRVRLIDLLDGRIYDQRLIELPIIEGDTLPPTITSFTAGATSVDVFQLANRTALIPVSWSVENRPDNSNLVFEQVFADGRTVNVELPRSNPWVPSSGNGVASPVLELGATSVKLRVRLVNLNNNTTITQRELTIPITGSTSSVPSYVVDPAWCYTEPFMASNGLQIGRTARVTANVPAEGVRVFGSPYGGLPLGYLPANTTIDVLEGPFCYRLNIETAMQSEFRLWRVRGHAQPSVAGWALEYVRAQGSVTSYLSDVFPPAEEGGGGEGTLSIDTLTLAPDPVLPNSYLTITWATSGASAVALNLLDGPGGQVVQPIVSPGQMPLTGTMAYPVPADAEGSITFSLVASDEAGNQVTEEATASIGGCEFENTLTDRCPSSQVTVTGAFQPFEGGYMVWRGDTRTIYVLFGDDSTWATYPDTWVEGDQVDTGEPPQGRAAPVRGFGKVWVNESLSDRLGWGLGTEQAYNLTIEEYLADGNFPALGLNLPDGSVVLLGETWQIQ